MRHLGGVVSALVDGHLQPATAERLLAHAVTCPPCRARLAAERSVKTTLVRAPAPTPPQSLIQSLLEGPRVGP